MIISLNWLKKYVDIDVPTEELVELIGARLVEVEEIVDIRKKYEGIKIVEVKSAEKIADSDHLTLCKIWDGANEHQVVCGAPNVRVGMLAVWLPAGVTVPSTFGDDEPFVLDKRKLRGYESNGMLAAMDELDFGTDHSGIVEVDPNMICHPAHAASQDLDRKVQPGDDFAKVFGLDDVLLDIENKSLTHRPDCFGIIGFAREVAGILGQKFETPDWLSESVVKNTMKEKNE
ncbi:hypothetical protein FACS189431_1560 [Alphaproteobacteria bacterium]|nr:hypothetical protein FACS189431_1560 [Alphaproteobacteria bacterium]